MHITAKVTAARQSPIYYRHAHACHGVRDIPVRALCGAGRKAFSGADIPAVFRKQTARRDPLRKPHGHAEKKAPADAHRSGRQHVQRVHRTRRRVQQMSRRFKAEDKRYRRRKNPDATTPVSARFPAHGHFTHFSAPRAWPHAKTSRRHTPPRDVSFG